MIGTTVGHYSIVDRLGAGGMGVVYKARDVNLGRTVALKFLPPELTRDETARRRFEREARAASMLDHPNICTIHEVGQDEQGHLFIAMAYYTGRSLDQRIAQQAIPWQEAVSIALQVARGLAKAHAAGIVHRDIKPANVIITDDDVVKILDFGLAKPPDTSTLTRPETVLGTLAYMSPEQLKGEEAGPVTDIWALGVVLFEMIAGRRPFGGDYPQSIAYAILNEQPAALGEIVKDVPPELERVIKRMLRKDPLQRYSSIDTLAPDLEPYGRPDSPSGSPSRRVPGAREKLVSGARLGPYQVVRPLGSGGMGDVYLAKDTRLDREVALKVLAPEFSEDSLLRERFRREAKTISSLSHPRICTVFDVGEQEGVDFIVMEYLDGETLAGRLARGPLPLGQVLQLGAQIAEGLGRAHRQGIVHRDLKPANVMLTAAGGVKLLDFGLAKGIASAFQSGSSTRGPSGDHPTMRLGTGSGKPLTGEGSIVGTLPYMAPEQVEGREADARTDIFALGAILYEMLTGGRAFGGETSASLIAAIIDREPQPVAKILGSSPAGELEGLRLTSLDRLIRKCLAKMPDERWQNADDIGASLVWIAEISDQPVAPADVVAVRKRTLVLSGVVIAVLVFSLGAALLKWTATRPESAGAPAPLPVKVSVIPITLESGTEFLGDLSPDGRFVLYTKIGDGVLDVLSQRVGGWNSVNLTGDNPSWDAGPAWSPDGNSIAFCSIRAPRTESAAVAVGESSWGIFVMGATGESVRRLTDSGFFPDWSPDGRTIVYTTSPDHFVHGRGQEHGILRAVSVDGGEPHDLYGGDAVMPKVSPGGQRIAFWSGYGDIGTIPFSGGELVWLLDGPESDSYPTWSSDGRFIYFLSDRGGSSNLWRIPVDEATGKALGPPEPKFVPADYVQDFALSSDDQQVLFTAWERKARVMSVGFDESTGTLVGTPELVIENALEFDYLDISLDGLTLAMHSRYPTFDLFTLDLADHTLRRLTNDRYMDRTPTWSPDGKSLIFESARLGYRADLTVNPDGSGMLPLTSEPESGALRYPRWSPDGTRFVSAGPEAQGLIHERDESGTFRSRELPPLRNREHFFFPSAWFSDGKRILGMIRSNETGTPRGEGMAILNLETNEYQVVSDVGFAHLPTLTANERWALAVRWWPAQVVAVDLTNGEQHVLIEQRAANEGRRLTYCKKTKRIFYVVAPWESNIWLATLE